MSRTADQLAVVTAAADVVEAGLVHDETVGASVVVPTGRDRHLSPETVAAIEASVADSTRRAYSADQGAFAAWCTKEDHTAVPSAETMAEWVRHLTVTPRPGRTGPPGRQPSSVPCPL
ncbi:hypothetical protein ACFW5W_34080 [Streptomyces sp. NPDC058783]|uniref:hypothetical protein n=1 Tax=Streptomyces sp. NPDC058783 TaxID=3346633 RepID=UPI0036CA7374